MQYLAFNACTSCGDGAPSAAVVLQLLLQAEHKTVQRRQQAGKAVLLNLQNPEALSLLAPSPRPQQATEAH